MKKQHKKMRKGLERGFTLFELVLALAISGMVLTSIFKISDGAVRSTRQMLKFQDEDITRDAFFSFLRQHFDRLPGNAVVDLVETQSSEPILSEMTFQNTPVSFNWGGVPISAQATRLITVPTLSNGVDVVLEYYDERILDSDEGPAERGIDPIASVTLLYDVRLFEWQVVDLREYEPDRGEWEIEWDEPRRLPGFVELTVVFQVGDSPIKRLFWIPNRANPQSTMAALQNAARGARQNPGGVNPPGGGGRPGGNQGGRPGGNQGGNPRGGRGGQTQPGGGSR